MMSRVRVGVDQRFCRCASFASMVRADTYGPCTCILFCVEDANVSFGALISITAVLGRCVIAFSKLGKLCESSGEICVANGGVYV